ncbi:hypothetical protein H1R20_g3604, partial [Candolleomyces eurysporus]
MKLNTGAEMPTVGLGTWKSQPGQVEGAVEHALKFGYRHVDTATAYENETEVGKGIKASGVPRSEIFLTTKLNNTDHGDTAKALEYSLNALGTDYLDLCGFTALEYDASLIVLILELTGLMHWPAPMRPDNTPDKTIDWLNTWKEMVKLYKAHPEKLRVSNFSVTFLERLLADTELVPAVNQIELHAACPQEDVVDFCRKKGIVVTAYSPLGSDGSPLLTNEVVKKIADKHGVHPANILISLQANRPGVNVLTKSVTPARIESNYKLVDLTEEEIAELHEIDKTLHFRACHPSWTGWGGLGFPDCLDSPVFE